MGYYFSVSRSAFHVVLTRYVILNSVFFAVHFGN